MAPRAQRATGPEKTARKLVEKEDVPKNLAAPKSGSNKSKQVTATTVKKQPTVKGLEKPAAKSNKGTLSSAEPEPSSIPAKESATISSKKRPRTGEPAVDSKPAKRPRSEPSINTPPSQRLDIYVFGSGECGELGLGHLKRNGKKPLRVLRPRLNDLLDANTVGVIQIAVGGMHCVALTHDHKILSWGVNDLGALGRDTSLEPKTASDNEDSDDEDDTGLNPKESTPAAISSGYFGEDTKFAQVVATNSASFALTVTGSVYGWGTFSGGDGVIGFTKAGALAAKAAKKQDVQRTPILIPELSQIKLLAAGGNHMMALDHKGDVFTWGSGEQYQHGRKIADRLRAHALVPSKFGLPMRKIKKIAGGAFHSFAIDDKNQVLSWGLNNFGQTGISNGAGEANAVIATPTVVESLRPYKITEIHGGNHHSVACTEDHKLLVWGRCDDSQPGIPLEKLPKSSLIFDAHNKPGILAIPAVIPDISAAFVAAGIDNSIAITEKGEAYSWGFSANYRTGLGTDDTVEEPTKIQNTALVGKRLTFSACGGQFGVLAGPASVDGI